MNIKIERDEEQQKIFAKQKYEKVQQLTKKEIERVRREGKTYCAVLPPTLVDYYYNNNLWENLTFTNGDVEYPKFLRRSYFLNFVPNITGFRYSKRGLLNMLYYAYNVKENYYFTILPMLDYVGCAYGHCSDQETWMNKKRKEGQVYDLRIFDENEISGCLGEYNLKIKEHRFLTEKEARDIVDQAIKDLDTDEEIQTEKENQIKYAKQAKKQIEKHHLRGYFDKDYVYHGKYYGFIIEWYYSLFMALISWIFGSPSGTAEPFVFIFLSLAALSFYFDIKDCREEIMEKASNCNKTRKDKIIDFNQDQYR